MKDIKLSIVETYVSHWSWWQGARELMQNAIDTDEHDIMFLHDTIVIVSKGGKIPVNALLMGKSTKGDDETKIGKFGEGMKVGFLVLLREGAEIVMYNGQDIWTPALKYDETYDEKVLTVTIEEGARPARDDTVTVHIKGIPPEAMKTIRENYAPETNLVPVISNYKGTAYKKEREGTPCRLYINGLFVTEVPGKFKFDYSFRPEAFVLDRDRDTVSTFEVKYEAARLLAGCQDVLLLANLACENYDDLKDFSGRFENFRNGSQGGYYEDEDQEYTLEQKATELFFEKHGDDAFPVNEVWPDKKKRLVTSVAIKKGLVPVTVNCALHQMIETQFDIDAEVVQMVDFKPLEWLQKFRDKHGRHLYAKARKDLDRVVEMLKVVENKE